MEIDDESFKKLVGNGKNFQLFFIYYNILWVGKYLKKFPVNLEHKAFKLNYIQQKE